MKKTNNLIAYLGITLLTVTSVHANELSISNQLCLKKYLPLESKMIDLKNGHRLGVEQSAITNAGDFASAIITFTEVMNANGIQNGVSVKNIKVNSGTDSTFSFLTDSNAEITAMPFVNKNGGFGVNAEVKDSAVGSVQLKKNFSSDPMKVNDVNFRSQVASTAKIFNEGSKVIVETEKHNNSLSVKILKNQSHPTSNDQFFPSGSDSGISFSIPINSARVINWEISPNSKTLDFQNIELISDNKHLGRHLNAQNISILVHEVQDDGRIKQFEYVVYVTYGTSTARLLKKAGTYISNTTQFEFRQKQIKTEL